MKEQKFAMKYCGADMDEALSFSKKKLINFRFHCRRIFLNFSSHDNNFAARVLLIWKVRTINSFIMLNARNYIKLIFLRHCRRNFCPLSVRFCGFFTKAERQLLLILRVCQFSYFFCYFLCGVSFRFHRDRISQFN